MRPSPILDRRTFLADLGRGTFALAVVALAGCAPTAQATPGRTAAATASTRPTGSGPATDAATPATEEPDASQAVTWERVSLGFVSAYILARGGEAAIVDTGVGGSGDAIEEALGGVGLDWSAVGHLILTHRHSDHVGSASDILDRAAEAVGYAGREDLDAIPAARPLTAVGDGDEVFGLTIVTTPGHTPGSISVLDPVGGVLVAGDALGTDDGRPTLPGAQFTEDMGLARRSVVKLGGLAFETLLVGHGDPIEGGASALVADLGASG